MSELVTTECGGGICVLSLHRPQKLNAVDLDLILALRDAVGAAQARPDARVLILRGEGRAFCAGNDLEATERMLADGVDRAGLETHAQALQEVTRRLCLGEKFVIGAIHGWAVGAGFEWALNCDLSVWGESARGFMPETRLGVFATGGALALLPRLVGPQRAREMLLFGDQYGAHELKALGIATRVVADGEELAEARRLAERVLELPASAVARLKRTLNRTDALALEATLDLEAEALVESVLEAAKAGAAR